MRRDRLARLERREPPRTPPAVAPPRPDLRSPDDILALLEDEVASLRADVLVSAAERARGCGQLAAVALRAVEMGTLAARLAAIEAVLKSRKAEARG